MNNTIRFDVVFNNIDDMLKGILVTLELTLVAIILSTMMGLLVTVIWRKGNKIIHLIISGYVEIMRNVPILVVLYFIYFGLGEISINFGSFGSVILALTLCNGAYISEIFRAGIEALPISQTEAGVALGMHNYQVFFRIIMPQAFINIFPSLINQYIILMLSTSFASLVALDELTSTVSKLSSFSFRSFEFYIVGALVYLFFTVIIALIAKITEKRFKNGKKVPKRRAI